jgi:hypothetical protein
LFGEWGAYFFVFGFFVLFLLHRISELAEILPRMDAKHNTIMEVLYTMISSSYTNGTLNLFYYGIAFGCKLTMQFGVSPFSANTCACFTGALAKDDQWEESYQFCKLALGIIPPSKHQLSLPHHSNSN